VTTTEKTGLAGIPTDAAREKAAETQRTRRTYGRLAVVVCGIFALSAFLPGAEERYRAGVLTASGLLFVVVMLWLRLVPPGTFGDRSLVAFGLLLQPILVAWLTLTDGIESPFFPYFLLPVLMTVYSPHIRHTWVIAAASAVSLVAIAVLDRDIETGLQVTNRLTIDLIELIVFVATAAGIGRRLRDARRVITDRAATLAVEREDAVRLANTDALTGLYNRRYAEELLVRLVAEATRGRPFAVVALDVDGLKRVNDTRGHETGDRVLKQVAEILRQQLRGADIAVRLGGDEFLALLPGTRDVQAQAVTVRLRRAVETHDWSDVGAEVSLSGGAAEWQTGQSGADVVAAADARLYQAKRARPSGSGSGQRPPR
jgi:diguanylate cyclase (GGDEF)-like protein